MATSPSDPSPSQQRAGGALMASIAVGSGYTAAFVGLPAIIASVVFGLAAVLLFSVSARS
ncbi:MAG: hypothetical protein QM817_17145 [Archangium sp.]